MIRPPRLSLAMLIGPVAFCAATLAALRSSSPYWASALVSLTVLVLPYEYMYGEAILYDHARRVVDGVPLYQPIDRPPYTIANYLATQDPGKRPKTDHSEFKLAEAEVHQRTMQFLNTKGRRTVDSLLASRRAFRMAIFAASACVLHCPAS